MIRHDRWKHQSGIVLDLSSYFNSEERHGQSTGLPRFNVPTTPRYRKTAGFLSLSAGHGSTRSGQTEWVQLARTIQTPVVGLNDNDYCKSSDSPRRFSSGNSLQCLFFKYPDTLAVVLQLAKIFGANRINWQSVVRVVELLLIGFEDTSTRVDLCDSEQRDKCKQQSQGELVVNFSIQNSKQSRCITHGGQNVLTNTCTNDLQCGFLTNRMKNKMYTMGEISLQCGRQENSRLNSEQETFDNSKSGNNRAKSDLALSGVSWGGSRPALPLLRRPPPPSTHQTKQSSDSVWLLNHIRNIRTTQPPLNITKFKDIGQSYKKVQYSNCSRVSNQPVCNRIERIAGKTSGRSTFPPLPKPSSCIQRSHVIERRFSVGTPLPPPSTPMFDLSTVLSSGELAYPVIYFT